MNVSGRASAARMDRNPEPIHVDPAAPNPALCITHGNRTGVRTQHQQQMDGFLYTVFILAFYALTMLYFMLRQICRQEKRSRNRFYQLRFVTSDYTVGREERMHRAQMKKQLCVHLIKMGQLTQAFVSTANTDALIPSQKPVANRTAPQASSETDPILADGAVTRKYSKEGNKALQRQARVRTLMRDQSTSTDPNYETIIDIESVNSEVSV